MSSASPPNGDSDQDKPTVPTTATQPGAAGGTDKDRGDQRDGSLFTRIMATAALVISIIALVLALTHSGPKGDKGDTGAQGTPGIQGSPGLKGDKGDPGDPYPGLYRCTIVTVLHDSSANPQVVTGWDFYCTPMGTPTP